MKHALWATAFLLLITACGGNSLPSSSSIVATITPSQATVQAGGAVTLAGSATGFTGSPIVEWWIQESKNVDFYNDCGKLDDEVKDFAACPNGIVMFHDVTTFPSTATYYAPPTPGTYHVTFRAMQVVAYDSVEKTATATITVTP